MVTSMTVQRVPVVRQTVMTRPEGYEEQTQSGRNPEAWSVVAYGRRLLR